MNFEEDILLRCIEHLRRNLWIGSFPPDRRAITEKPNGVTILPKNPNEAFSSVLQDVKRGVIEELPVPNPATPPTAYVDYNGGRNDDATASLLTHLVEVLEIRIDINLHKKTGVGDENGVFSISKQGADLRADINRLINFNSLRSATGQRQNVIIENVVQSEWEFDDRYRGGDQEILTIIFQAVVHSEQSQSQQP